MRHPIKREILRSFVDISKYVYMHSLFSIDYSFIRCDSQFATAGITK